MSCTCDLCLRLGRGLQGQGDRAEQMTDLVPCCLLGLNLN